MKGFRIADASSRLLMSAHRSQHSKLFCTGNNKNSTNKANGVVPPGRDLDLYQQLEKLDFMTAAKILFTTPPKKKKFGIDFHLQEEELKKKQAEEEEKVKEIEASSSEEIPELGSDPDLLDVKVRLDALEETVKQIALETKKISRGNLSESVSPNSASKPSASIDKSGPNLTSVAVKSNVSHETVSVSAAGPNTAKLEQGNRSMKKR